VIFSLLGLESDEDPTLTPGISVNSKTRPVAIEPVGMHFSTKDAAHEGF